MKKSFYKLKVDPEFEALIPPMKDPQYILLEKELKEFGCNKSIRTWDGYIIEGFQRYNLCMKHRIPFSIVRMWFPTRNDVIAWICDNQLSRQGLIDENRRYLIGMQYNAEREAAESSNENTGTYGAERKIVENLSVKYGASLATIRRYGRYTRAVDYVEGLVPGFRNTLLTGEYRLPVEHMIRMSGFSAEQIQVVVSRLEEQRKARQSQTPFLNYAALGRTHNSGGSKVPTVKDMPAFDPDAEINALALTVPTWTGSIDRVMNSVELGAVSTKAKNNLRAKLLDLKQHVNNYLSTVGDDS